MVFPVQYFLPKFFFILQGQGDKTGIRLVARSKLNLKLVKFLQ